MEECQVAGCGGHIRREEIDSEIANERGILHFWRRKE